MHRSDPPMAYQDAYPRQGDDEDDPAPLRSTDALPASRALRGRARRRARLIAWLMLGLGVLGIALGVFLPNATMEVLIGGILALLGLRALNQLP